MHKLLIKILFVLLLAGCEVAIDKPLMNTPPVKLVVDAIITNQPGESYVKLSLPVASPNDVSYKVSGALVYVSDGLNTVALAEDSTEAGTYKPDHQLRGVSGKIYGILIYTDSFIDSAYTYLTPVSPLKAFSARANNSKPGNFFISGENNGDPAMIRYTIDPPGCTGDPACRQEIFEYILSSFDVPQIFSPKKESISFPSGSRVIRKKYSLNPQYESYLRAVLSETEWRGGLFDVQPGNPRGNFGKSTLGYFAGCSMVMDTTYIQ